MTADERRVEVAAEALYVKWLTGPTPTSVADLRDLALADARAVVAALDAHDGDLRERLAGAVEASARVDAGAPWVSGLHIAARIIRERP